MIFQKTAIPLEVAARFQINLLIEPIPSISTYKNVQRKFMPILWFEQHVKMSQNIGDEVKFILSMPSIGVKSGFLFILIGFLQIMLIPCAKILSRLFCSRKHLIETKNIGDIEKKKEKPEKSPLMKKKIHHIKSKTLILH